VLEQRVEHEAGVVSHVHDDHPQQIVHVAGHGVALDDFRPELDVACEVAHGCVTGSAVLVQADIDVREQPEAYLGRVDERHVFLDEALLFKTPHSAQAGAGRQRDAVRQLLIAEASVALQFSQNP